jgi:cellulose synthase/poly-beta-1,6-N-acetylglucosamine synthase-like glycosyltransferase
LNIFTFTSTIFLIIILSWVTYHTLILFAGIKNKQKHNYAKLDKLPKFSLIIPAKNESAVIERCLNALIKIDYPKENLEIIIVNGNSQDNTQQICEEFSKKHPKTIKVIHEQNARGKPAALNFAFTHVSNEIIGVFDADSVPEPTVLHKIASYFQNPTIMAVQGSTHSVNEKQNMLTRIAEMEDRAWFQGLLCGRDKLKLFVPLTGSCQFVRRDILDKLGGWDESALAEDVELALKLTQQNHIVTFASDVVSGQETPNTFKSLFAQRTRWYRGYMEAALKHTNLLKKINKKTIDAQISLIGPFILIICLASYFNWGLSIIFAAENNFSPFSAFLVVALTSITLLSLGVSFVFTVKPIKPKNIIWVPFVYFYLTAQMIIATWAFTQILLRRRKVWTKTNKDGSSTPSKP